MQHANITVCLSLIGKLVMLWKILNEEFSLQECVCVWKSRIKWQFEILQKSHTHYEPSDWYRKRGILDKCFLILTDRKQICENIQTKWYFSVFNPFLHKYTCETSVDPDQLAHQCHLIRIWTGRNLIKNNLMNKKTNSLDPDQTALHL